MKHLYSLPVCDTCLGNDECPGDWEEVLMNGRRFCGGESAGDQTTTATCRFFYIYVCLCVCVTGTVHM